MPLSISPIPTKATHGCTWSKQPNSFPSRQAREAKCTFRQDRASRLTSVCGLSSLGHLVYPFFSLLPVLAPERSGCSTFWAGGGFLRVCPYPLFSLLQLGTQDGMYKGVKLRMYWDEGQWKDLQVLHRAGLHRVGWSLPRPALQVFPKTCPALTAYPGCL